MKLRVSKGVLFFSIWQSAQIICKIHTFTITFYTFLIATVGTLFVADSHKLAAIITQDSSLVVFSIAFGIVGTVIPYLTYTVGLRFIENGKASIIASVDSLYFWENQVVLISDLYYNTFYNIHVAFGR